MKIRRRSMKMKLSSSLKNIFQKRCTLLKS